MEYLNGINCQIQAFRPDISLKVTNMEFKVHGSRHGDLPLKRVNIVYWVPFKVVAIPVPQGCHRNEIIAFQGFVRRHLADEFGVTNTKDVHGLIFQVGIEGPDEDPIMWTPYHYDTYKKELKLQLEEDEFLCM